MTESIHEKIKLSSAPSNLSMKTKKFKNLKRAARLGEILNLFYTSEEVENKKLFEGREKDYAIRMIENNIFPKKFTQEHQSKLTNLLKNKDCNYSVKRKFMKNTCLETNEDGKFRLTLNRSFYRKLIEKGEINLKSRKVMDNLNRQILENKPNFSSLNSLSKNIFKPIREKGIDNMTNDLLATRNSNFNQAIKDVVKHNYHNIDLQTNSEGFDNFEALNTEENEKRNDNSNILIAEGISNTENNYNNNYDYINNISKPLSKKNLKDIKDLTVNLRKGTTTSNLDKNIIFKISDIFDTSSNNNNSNSNSKSKKKKIKTRDKNSLREIVPEFYQYENKHAVNESDLDSETDSANDEYDNRKNTVGSGSNTNVKANVNENTKGLKEKKSNLERALLAKIEKSTNKNTKSNVNTDTNIFNSKHYFGSDIETEVDPNHSNFYNFSVPTQESFPTTKNSLSAFSPKFGSINRLKTTVSKANIYTNNTNHKNTKSGTSKSKDNFYITGVELPKIDKIKNYRKTLNIIKNNIEKVNEEKKSDNNVFTKKFKYTELFDSGILETNELDVNKKESHLLGIVSLKNDNYNFNYKSKDSKTSKYSNVRANANTNIVNEAYIPPDLKLKRENVTDRRSSSRNMGTTSLSKVLNEDNNHKICNKQTMFIYEKKKWESIKKDNVSIL